MSTQKWQPPKAVIQRRELAEKWSLRTHVPAALILATIQQESGGNPKAVRAEAGYLKQYGATPKFVQIVKATRLMPEQVAASYGLMQLMLPLAWGYMSPEDKETGALSALLDPDKNIRYGAAHLASLIKGRPISGAVIRDVAGKFNGAGSDSAYARNVCALWRKYEEAIQ